MSRRRREAAVVLCRACQRMVGHLTVRGFCVLCSGAMSQADAKALHGAYTDARREIRKQGSRFQA